MVPKPDWAEAGVEVARNPSPRADVTKQEASNFGKRIGTDLPSQVKKTGGSSQTIRRREPGLACRVELQVYQTFTPSGNTGSQPRCRVMA